MKKFLLVTMIGLVLAMDLYGIVNQFMIDDGVKEIDHIKETTVTVYTEQQMLFLLVLFMAMNALKLFQNNIAIQTSPFMEE